MPKNTRRQKKTSKQSIKKTSVHWSKQEQVLFIKYFYAGKCNYKACVKAMSDKKFIRTKTSLYQFNYRISQARQQKQPCKKMKKLKKIYIVFYEHHYLLLN